MKGMKTMLKRVSSIPFHLALIAALMSAAPLLAARDYGVTSVHQPVVRRIEYVLDVEADMAAGSIEDQRLAEWLDALTPGYGDQVAIDLGGRPSAGRLSVILRARLAKFGLTETAVLPVPARPVPANKVRIILRRSIASVPGCPDYRGVGGADTGNGGIPGYGCAINGNIASMIADPNDLLEGKAAPPGEGWRAAKDAAATNKASSGSFTPLSKSEASSTFKGSAGHD